MVWCGVFVYLASAGVIRRENASSLLVVIIRPHIALLLVIYNVTSFLVCVLRKGDALLLKLRSVVPKYTSNVSSTWQSMPGGGQRTRVR